MALRSRRSVQYLALVVATTVALTLVYNTGMATWENRPQPLYRSFEVVIQSFTTTGYGEDAPWQSPQMNLFVVVMQFAGIGLVLTAVDVFAVPWLRDTLRPTAPAAAAGVEDHVVVCGYTPRTDAFITKLDAREQGYVLVEPAAETARDLHEDGYQVVHGDPESTETLRNARLGSASALVADVADDANASVALSAREVNPDVRVVTLLEDAALGQYHRAAGVTESLSPRKLVGESLAAEIPAAVTDEGGEDVGLGEDFGIAELAVAEDSDLAGQTFAESGLGERAGTDVIGSWADGDFETPVAPDATLDAGTRLLVVGETERLDALRAAVGSTVQDLASQRIVLAGYGDAGEAAARTLDPTLSRLTVLDVEPGPDVDVAGDARDPDALEAAGIRDASALVLTVGDDTTAIFTTLIARELNPDLRIVVRANEEASVQKLYRAGADYVQSLPTVSGRMLVSTTLTDERALTYDQQVSIVRLPAPGLEGRTITAAAVRAETGCTVMAVVRDGETIAEFDPDDLVVQPGDEVVIAGADEAVTRFERQFG